MGRPADEIVKELEAERDLLREALLPFALHAKALGLPKRDDVLTVISEKFGSFLGIGAFRTALEMFPELHDSQEK